MFGIISALGAASSWTYACFLWRQQTKYFSAVQINIIKNVIAFAIFFPVLLTFDFQSSLKEILILLLSGIIGISIGDSLYLMALKALGTRRTLSVEALSPLIATILGSGILNEFLSFKIWLGVFIVSFSLLGIALQDTKVNLEIASEMDKKTGFFLAFLSVLCAVIAGILSRFVLINSDLNPFQSTEIRLLGGIIALLPFVDNSLTKLIKQLTFKNKSRLLFATFLGTNIGILLQQNVFNLLPIGIAWTLLSTSPVIALFFARAEGEELNWKTLFLTSTTILGLSIVFIS